MFTRLLEFSERIGKTPSGVEHFADPDRFDVRRANASEHLAFGHGIRFCIGANLARKEMQLAFRALLARLDDFRLSPGSPEPRHKPVLLRALAELHLDFTGRAA